MNGFKVLGSATPLVAALFDAHPALASCSHSTQITNDSSTTLTFVELKSAVTPPTFFKKQWTGTRAIAPGATGTINWTSDWACTSSSGPNTWSVKFYRSNGNVHNCGNLGASQAVRVTTPNLCFPN
jgi:hypothetical protein